MFGGLGEAKLDAPDRNENVEDTRGRIYPVSYTTLRYTTLNRLRYTILRYTILHYTMLHYTTLHSVSLWYTVL